MATELVPTERQLQAARLWADGYSYPEAGTLLGLSARTVKAHVAAARERLGIPATSAGRRELRATLDRMEA